MGNSNSVGYKHSDRQDDSMCEYPCQEQLFDCFPQGTIVDVWFVAGFVRGTFSGINDGAVIITNIITATAYSTSLNASLPLGPMRILLKNVTAVSPGRSGS